MLAEDADPEESSSPQQEAEEEEDEGYKVCEQLKKRQGVKPYF